MQNNKKTKWVSLMGLLLFPLWSIAQVNLDSGLVLDLPFSGNANDTSASFLTGTVVNAVLTTDREGEPDRAYAFNGVDGINYGVKTDSSGSGGGGCNTKNGAPLVIGTRRLGDNQFTGAIDNIKIWNRTITDAEIQVLYSGTANYLEASLLKISLYPNPATGHFTIRSPETALRSIVLNDLTGRRLSAEIQLNRQDAEVTCHYQGLVVVQVLTERGIWIGKVRLK